MENATPSSCSCGAKAPSQKVNSLNIVSAVVFFLFPKCPICWAAYASFFSFMGMEQLQYHSYWQYLILTVFLLGSAYLLWRHYQNKSWWNIVLYTSGLVLLLTVYALNFTQIAWLVLVGALLLASNFRWFKNVSLSS